MKAHIGNILGLIRDDSKIFLDSEMVSTMSEYFSHPKFPKGALRSMLLHDSFSIALEDSGEIVSQMLMSDIINMAEIAKVVINNLSD